jgi:hypothetical protein
MADRSLAKLDEFEVLTEQQCLEYLHSADLGRLSLMVGPNIETFPVNYAADGAIVVFRTASGTRLETATQGRVAFEVDHWDPVAGVGWSVLLKGVASDVTSGHDPFSTALRERKVLPLAPGPRERWIAVYPSEISGRRLRRAADGS